jgi:hypothetical protein
VTTVARNIRHSVRVSERDFHAWTPAERRDQLSQLSRLCSDLAAAFASHDPQASAAFQERADHADALLRHGWEQSDLNTLAGEFPEGAWWLSPKAEDVIAGLEPWQVTTADLARHARSVAINLRSVATSRD